MADYIERDAVVDLITRRYENPEICTQEINSIPAADVAPVVHGRWMEHLDEMECSVCKRQWNYCDNDTNTFNFCPNCGATMDGERKDGDADNGGIH